MRSFTEVRQSLSELKLFKQVDASSLTVFRIGFGIIMVWDVWRYWSAGWISRFYIEPPFHFKYFGFEWVEAWSGDGMYWHFALIALSAFFISIGFLYRLSTLVFALAFSYIFLLDQAKYLNHFYMVILFAISLCVLPANRSFSIDAKIWPRLRSQTVPKWSVWLIRSQMEIILIFAGIVKINYDWLHLEPLSTWLGRRGDFPIFGYLFTQEWSVAVAAYGAIALHLIGAPLLLWKKTRIYVFAIYACFHTLNHFVFNIGIFPWFTLFASLMFFNPDWPKQLHNRYRQWRNQTKIDYAIKKQINSNTSASISSLWTNKTVTGFLIVWLGFQLLFPLRHVLYPGNVSWTEEGHRFAWQMKLRGKSGKSRFFVVEPASRRSWVIYPQRYLTRRQYRKMSTRPDMILQFAHFLRDDWAVKRGLKEVEVHAEVYAALNGRKMAPLIDPNRDLAKVERDLWHADWILPLTEPFRKVSR